MNITQNRLTALRAAMKAQGIEAFIVPNSDAHFSEYTAKHWKSLCWTSGFTGSAATLVVTLTAAALWTDSRYFIQADQQLVGSGIELKKLKVAGTESVETWLQQQLAPRSKVGIDGTLFSVKQCELLEENLTGLKLTFVGDLFTDIWTDRPPLPRNKAFLLANDLVGRSRSEKLRAVVQTAKLNDALYIVTALDEVAWLLNLRGTDVLYNPVVIAYAVIEYPTVHLFIGPEQLNAQEQAALQADGVQLHDYDHYTVFLKSLDKNRNVKINSNKLTIHDYQVLKQQQVTMTEETDTFGVITSLKSCKNEIELAGFRRAMLADGVALLRFWKWLEEQMGKTSVTEVSASERLHEFRALCPDFVGDSFGTIAAYGANGAAPHYSASADNCASLAPEAFFLLDSGGQYCCGTTDITRTVHLGTPSTEECEDYTLVLKGMIALSRAKFMAGTRGAQLDVLARQYLWARGKNYLHGTGHGVGHFLNVHEGPQSIRMEDNQVSLQPGMVISNEPAIYQTGKYGIRTENLIACRKDKSTDFGDFYDFETLTLYPIDTKAIDLHLLTAEEVDWLNAYHQQVFAALGPLLNEEERLYLRTKTQKIKC